MNKQPNIIPIALVAGLIFLMLAAAPSFLTVQQQHIVKAQSTSPAANSTGKAPPGTSPAANSTVTGHLPKLKTISPPIAHRCGSESISCG